MHILVLNAGSSSLKWQLIAMPSGEVLTKGLAERIGEPGKGKIHFGDEIFEGNLPSHVEALKKLKDYLNRHSEWEVNAVGHRVVHGGNEFVEPVRITDRVKLKIKSLFGLAPLHNPPNLSGIAAAEKFFPGTPQVAVFDTAFHQSIPQSEHRYAIPEVFYKQGIRQYGFHGISHSYIAKKVAEITGRTSLKIISLHLGNGASATAVADGKSVAHSMGFGPLPGLIMGTRSGDVDPSVLLYWMEQGMTAGEISRVLNKESGLSALAGSNDMREVERLYETGDKNAVLAVEMYVKRIKKYIGAFTALMNGLDVLVFTAGVGEHSMLIRKKVCENSDYTGLFLDEEKNKNPERFKGIIHAERSRVQIMVIPTDEEREIASQTYDVLTKTG